MNIVWRHCQNTRVSATPIATPTLLMSHPQIGKKFQNVAKEGLKFGDEGDDHKEQLEQLKKDYEPLTAWLKDTALSSKVGVVIYSVCVYI